MPDLWMDVDAALAEVPVNIMPLLDDTDFKSREEAVAYNAAGLELIWHFVTTAGATSATVVTPTTGGNYDWAHQDGGMYTIEIPASGGASINNDTEGFGWFTGVVTGVLPWRGPVIGFRAAGLNNALIDSAHSATRGLAGTALPDAAADAAGGLIISDAGGLDADDLKADVTAILEDTGTTLQGELDGIQADTEDIQTKIGAAGAGLTAVPWNAAWDAEVQSEAQDAITASGLATAAELAKVPKSDSNVSWNATALAAINAEVDTALNTAIPGSPTADSINERVATMDGRILGTLAAGTHTAQTGDSYARIGAAGAGLTAITGVKLDATQGAVTFGQVKITADVAYEGALDVVNSHTDGYGLKNFGGTYGQLNEATGLGIRVGLRNSGLIGQENFGAGAGNAGLFNMGGSGADGQRNDANSGIGLHNVGTSVGQMNAGADVQLGTGTGLWNEGATIGEYNVSTDGIGQLNSGDAKDVEGFDPALATEAELAKIPKSDSNVSWNATALASMQQEATDALNAYDPPTKAELDTGLAGPLSANVTQISGDSTAADRLEAVLDATPGGVVVDDNDPDPTATLFETNLTEATNDHYNGAFVVFASGALLGQSRRIMDYDGTNKVLSVAVAFTEAPAAGDAFVILGRSE